MDITANQPRNNIFAKINRLMEHPLKISDSVGIPSTLGAMTLNIMQMLNLSNINMILTLVISLLSITYLLINISIKYRELKKTKRSKSNHS